MIIVKLWGGMGNQMFQYACGRSLAHRHHTELKLDLGFYDNQPVNNKAHVFRTYDLDIFNIQAQLATPGEIKRLGKRFSGNLADRVANRLLGYKKSYIAEPHFHFSEKVFHSPDNVYLVGYWQTEKYFSNISSLIRSDFSFKEPMSEKAAALRDTIANTNSVCLNVRRGDFVSNSFHGSYGTDYFKKAEELLKQKVSGYTYFVFSDEIEWCEANLDLGAPAVFVSHEYAGRKFQDYLRLMIACKHYIIPNSSFAWWAVWLNQDQHKTVIAPKVWFTDPSYDTKDISLPGWIRI